MKRDLCEVCVKILSDKEESKKLLSYESLDELYGYFLEKLPGLTQEEFDEFICESLESYEKEQKSLNEIQEESLEEVSGGAHSFSSRVMAGILGLLALASVGIAAASAKDNVGDVSSPQSVSTKEKIKMKISDAFQKTKAWVKAHPKLTAGIGLGAVAVTGAALIYRHYNKSSEDKNVGQVKQTPVQSNIAKTSVQNRVSAPAEVIKPTVATTPTVAAKPAVATTPTVAAKPAVATTPTVASKPVKVATQKKLVAVPKGKGVAYHTVGEAMKNSQKDWEDFQKMINDKENNSDPEFWNKQEKVLKEKYENYTRNLKNKEQHIEKMVGSAKLENRKMLEEYKGKVERIYKSISIQLSRIKKRLGDEAEKKAKEEAERKKFEETVRQAREAAKKKSDMAYAVEEGNVEKLSELLDGLAEVERDAQGIKSYLSELLHYVMDIRDGGKCKAMVDFLISKGADVDAKIGEYKKQQVPPSILQHRDPWLILDKTPLMCAAMSGNTVAIESLIAHGADVNDSNSRWNTALMYAAGSGSEECIKILIKHGANTNASNMFGDSVLEFAKKGVIGILLEQGNISKDRLMDAIEHEAERGDEERLKILLESKDITKDDVVSAIARAKKSNGRQKGGFEVYTEGGYVPTKRITIRIPDEIFKILQEKLEQFS